MLIATTLVSAASTFLAPHEFLQYRAASLFFWMAWFEIYRPLHYIIDELEAGAEQLTLPEPGTIWDLTSMTS
jgi:hypothetical protein